MGFTENLYKRHASRRCCTSPVTSGRRPRVGQGRARGDRVRRDRSLRAGSDRVDRRGRARLRNYEGRRRHDRRRRYRSVLLFRRKDFGISLYPPARPTSLLARGGGGHRGQRGDQHRLLPPPVCSAWSTASDRVPAASGCACCCSTAPPPAATRAAPAGPATSVGSPPTSLPEATAARVVGPDSLRRDRRRALPRHLRHGPCTDLALPVRRDQADHVATGAGLGPVAGRAGTARPRRRARRDGRVRPRRGPRLDHVLVVVDLLEPRSVLDHVVVVADRPCDVGVVLRRRAASPASGAGVPIIGQARSTSPSPPSATGGVDASPGRRPQRAVAHPDTVQVMVQHHRRCRSAPRTAIGATRSAR